jgi:uncharacterized protein (DUF58 family)
MAHRRQVWLSREGWWYALVVACVLGGALGRQLNLLIMVGSILAGPLLFALLHGRFTLAGLAVARGLPPHLRAGGRLLVEISVSNRRRWTSVWGLQVRDTLQRDDESPSAGATSVSVYLPRIPAGTTRQADYRGRLLQRGRYWLGPLRVSTRFPLGLVRHRTVIDERAELLVHPSIGRLSHDWAQISLARSVGGLRMPRRGLVESDFYAMRDWRSGDSRRWIHWRTSARRGSLVVRQFEQRRSQDLALLVDLWQPIEPHDDDRQRVETVVSFVATVIAEACRQSGRQLTLSVVGRTHWERSGAATPFFFREQMDALAVIAAHQEQGLPDALGHCLALVPRNVPALVVSTRPIDSGALQRSVAERGALPGRWILCIDASAGELERYFHAS